ncbi:hypothetical protein Tco_1382712 [Tanacetum coccineum]
MIFLPLYPNPHILYLPVITCNHWFGHVKINLAQSLLPVVDVCLESWEDVESHPHSQETWNEVTPVKRGNTHEAGKSSDPIFVLTGIPSTPYVATSYPPDASSRVMENPNKHTNPVRDQRVVNKKHARHNRIKGIKGVTERVEVLQKSFEELKEARAQVKELFEEAKEENRKQYEECVDNE